MGGVRLGRDADTVLADDSARETFDPDARPLPVRLLLVGFALRRECLCLVEVSAPITVWAEPL